MMRSMSGCKKRILLLFTFVLVCMSAGMSARGAAKKGLVREDGAWYFYRSGKPVKNRWKTVVEGNKSSRYYFGADGKAVCAGGKNAKVIKIGKYTYAFDKKAHMLTGVCVIKGKLYCFSSAGRYNKTKTLQLRKKAKYGAEASGLVELLAGCGCKLKKTKFYGKGCLGDNEDGIYTFPHFQAAVLKRADGKIVIIDIYN